MQTAIDKVMYAYALMAHARTRSKPHVTGSRPIWLEWMLTKTSSRSKGCATYVGPIVLQSGERSETPYSEPILNGERLRAAARARRAFVGTSL